MDALLHKNVYCANRTGAREASQTVLSKLVSEILFSRFREVGTKNQDPDETDWYYVQVRWTTDGLCMVAGTDVDVFRPKKRAKLVRKSREALQASYYYYDNY